MKLFSEATYINICRWWLTGILLFLPFQHKLIELWNNKLSNSISYLDELTIVIFLPLVIREFYRKKEFPHKWYIILLFPVVILSIFGFISGLVNKNSLFITALGVFDYIKNFLVVFIYAVFFRDIDDLKQIFRFLLIIGVFLGIIAFIQELWALGSRYILKEDIRNIKYLLVQNVEPELSWRFKIYRAPSLLIHPNHFGFYSLLILTVYFFLIKKINLFVFISLLSGILTSVSRLVYTGFLLIAGLEIIRGRKLIIFPLVAIMVFSIFLTSLPDFDILDEINLSELTEKGDFTHSDSSGTGSGAVYYRTYTRDKALEVWKDHPFLGRGPGMFGGVVSTMFQSPVYDEYDFLGIVKVYLKQWKTIDQFWPQLLAEMGVVGILSFAGLFCVFFLTFFIIIKKKETPDEIKGLFKGLAIFQIIILIFTFGSTLNVAPGVFTYYVLVGMGLGCCVK